MNSETNKKQNSPGWKKSLKHEIYDYLFNFAFLAFFLVIFAWYRRLLLEEYHVENSTLTPLIESAILAKVIMIGDILGLGKRLRNRSIILIAVYRTIVFSLLVGVFTILEHMIEAWFHKESVAKSLAEVMSKGMPALIGKCVLILAAFIPFFVFKEFERVYGEKKMRGLLFHPQKDESVLAP